MHPSYGHSHNTPRGGHHHGGSRVIHVHPQPPRRTRVHLIDTRPTTGHVTVRPMSSSEAKVATTIICVFIGLALIGTTVALATADLDYYYYDSYVFAI